MNIISPFVQRLSRRNRVNPSNWTGSSFNICNRNHRRPVSNCSKTNSKRMDFKYRNIIMANQSLRFIVDFDGTITERDTLDILVHIAAQRNPDLGIADKWEDLKRAYAVDYEQTMKDRAPGGNEWSSSQAQMLHEELAEVEKRSVERVSASGIFANLTSEDIKQGAREAINSGRVKIRPGYGDFLRILKKRAERFNDTHIILSVNWSKTFIAACLEASVLQDPVNEGEFPGEFPSIWTNELEGVSADEATKGAVNDKSTGRIGPCSPGGRMIVSSNDKHNLFKEIPNINFQSPLKVYIGDSLTDWLCLAGADLGICIRDEPMTSSQQALMAYQTPPGCDHLLERPNRPATREVLPNETIQIMNLPSRPRIVWARNFSEIVMWLNETETSDLDDPTTYIN